MLRHQEEEKSAPPVVALDERVQQVNDISAPTKPRWWVLYDEYVADNPVYWKETQRPDLSALTPKLRARALESREKRRSSTTARRFLETLGVYVAITLVMCLVFSILENQFKGDLRSGIGMLAIPFLTPLLAAIGLAKGIALEREKRTWDVLLLTHLSPAQLLGGRALAWLAGTLPAGLMFSCFTLACVLNGSLPPLALAVSTPIFLTMALPSVVIALRAGLFARTAEKATSRAGLLQIGPVLLNCVAMIVGAAGLLAVRDMGWRPTALAAFLIPLWMSLVNIVWAGWLWRRLLRDFHKAPCDFSG